MDKLVEKKRLISIILGIALILGISVKYYKDYKNIDESTNITDAMKFKKEYEDLNGEVTSSDKKYLTVSIDKKNPMVYKTDSEIVDILENGTGVIYFGFNSCPWCRSVIETLINSAKENNVNRIYYVNIKDIRSKYQIKNGELDLIQKGSESYNKILEILDEYLREYTIEDKDTNEKRLYAPTVVGVKDGNIVGFHEATVPSQTDPYEGLTKIEKKELQEEYDKIFGATKDSTCEEIKGC